MSYSRVPWSRERIWRNGGEWLAGGFGIGQGEGPTPLVETHTTSEEWSNIRIWNGRVSSYAASSMSGGGAPPALKGPNGTAEVRMRGGTLLGKVTMLVVMVAVAVVTSVTSFVTGVAVIVVE